MTAIVEEILAGDQRASGPADLMLQTAEWAATAFARFDRARVDKIARAAADIAHAHAGELAEAAVEETGFGVVEHKKIKNELTSRGLYELYSKQDFCSPRVLPDQKMVELPRPAGIVFALTPSTNPVCTTYYKVMMTLATRNAIVVSPHPKAKACSARAAKLMAEAAEAAGAPAGIIQVIEQPNLPLIDHVMKSPAIAVILATGGTPMVRAAYGSGNPAIGVGPGNAPALVDESADLAEAAKRIVASKSFDNSILCTNESVVVAVEAIADQLLQRMKSAGAHVAKPEEVAALRELLFGLGSFNVEVLGKSAVEIGAMIGLRLSTNIKIIIAEIDRVGIDEPLSKEKLCPVLGFLRVPHAQAGIARACSLIRLSGPGHSAAIHSNDTATILAYGRQCALQPGRGRLWHPSRARLHHRHRFFRLVIGRRQCRAAASRQLDPHRLQRRCQGGVRRFRASGCLGGRVAPGARTRSADFSWTPAGGCGPDADRAAEATRDGGYG
jgi:acetaldehyde dehydrogenase/alcohol dehydrogenase